MTDNPKLFPCPDCEAQVSKRAKSCPHCGAPLGESESKEHDLKVKFSPIRRSTLPYRLSQNERKFLRHRATQYAVGRMLFPYIVTWQVALVSAFFLFDAKNRLASQLAIGAAVVVTVLIAMFRDRWQS